MTKNRLTKLSAGRLARIPVLLSLLALMLGLFPRLSGHGSDLSPAPDAILADSVTVKDSICAGNSYVFNGQLLTQTGTYIATFVASDGTDSVVTLILTVNLPVDTTLNAAICAGETYIYNGDTLDASGEYKYTFTGVNGCDSVVTLHLLVRAPNLTVLNAAVCTGSTFAFGDTLLGAGGTYTEVLTDVHGCDSTVTLNLIVDDTLRTNLLTSICQGDTLVFAGDSLVAPGVYADTLTALGGCDSIVTLLLNILPIKFTLREVGICTGSTYIFHGDTLSVAGLYTDTLTAASGCDSLVTLLLEVVPFFNVTVEASVCQGDTYPFGGQSIGLPGLYTDTLTAAGGCDSIVTLLLTVLPLPAPTTLNDTICSNESYLFHGDTLTAAGTYVATLAGANGCDSVITLQLEVLTAPLTPLAATICANETFNFEGQILADAGVYSAVYPAVNGCDSTVRLVLDVLPLAFTSVDVSICEGDSVEFNGQFYQTGGVYLATLTGANGCDSLVTLTLTVNPILTSALTVSICDNETYDFGGDTLALAGVYTDTLTSAAGCDSIVTLTLDVLPTGGYSLPDTICSGEIYIFYGQVLTTSGTYSEVFTGINGCDSIVSVALTVLPAPSTQLQATICANETYVFHGDTLSIAGLYSVFFPAANGCDSTVTLDLSVLPAPVTNLAATLCAGESYDFNGDTLTAGGFYSDTLSTVAGCDSTIQLVLTFVPEFTTPVFAAICAGETYVFGGDTLAQTGIYVDSLLAVGGCDSVVVLALTVLPLQQITLTQSICTGQSFVFDGDTLTVGGTFSATLPGSNGCDSTITLQLSVLPVQHTDLAVTICSNEPYPFNGQMLDSAGIYTATLNGVNGCDSTVTLDLAVLPAVATDLQASICAGGSYEFYGDTLTATGSYTAVLTAANGCDSILVLDLTVLPAPTETVSAAICEGQSYSFNGQTLTTAGTYTDTLSAANGCDSVLVLELTVDQIAVTQLADTICAGDSYSFGGQVLVASGVYTDTLVCAACCDSLVVLTLTVSPPLTGSATASICFGMTYDFNGQQLTTAGTYTTTFTASNGCDSTVTLQLSVLPVAHTVFSAAICPGESYIFHGDTLNTAGTYTTLLSGAAANGCDSIVSVDLTILPTPTTTISANICLGESYVFHGDTLEVAGIYTATLPSASGCDSVVVLTLNVNSVETGVTISGNTLTAVATGATFQWINCASNQPIPGATAASFTPTVTGLYAVRVTQNGCTELSNCVQVTIVGVGEPELGFSWNLQPNPAQDYTEVVLSRPADGLLEVMVYDLAGRQLLRQELPSGATSARLDLGHLPAGMLLVKMTDGKAVGTRRLVRASE